MIYFTQELLKNDCDDTWKEVCQRYYDNLRSLINIKISTSFFEFYENNDAFHDFVIWNIYSNNQVVDSTLSNTLIITTLHNGKKYNVIYTGVTSFEYRIQDVEMLKHSEMRAKGIDVILYDEIVNQDSLELSHEMLLVSGGIIKIYCDTIAIEEL